MQKEWSSSTAPNQLGWRAFLLTITASTTALIVIAAFCSSFSRGWKFNDSTTLYVLFLIGCVVVSLLGGLLADISESPAVSFVGGTICASALGLMVGPFVALYTDQSVTQAFVISAGIVVVTGLVGAIVPANLATWGAPLFGLLVGAIFIQFGAIALAWLGINMAFTFTIIDWAILLLFCGIMIYDLNRARHMEYSFNNAIDVSVHVFVNFVNIFVRVLSLSGKSSGD